MYLKTAIEILELNVKEAGKKMPADTLDALKLHVECAKAIRDWRNDNNEDLLWDLPGETPEGESP